jgi:lysophospholipase L1-like esterase
LVLGPGTARAGAGPWLAKAGPVRIMALGDSITAGVGAQGVDTGSGGYRGALERLLDTHSFHYTMIGGRSDYSAQVRMRAHEGWPGYVLRSFPSDRAPQLYGAVTKSAIESYDPDVILLMAGTNDLLRLAKHRPGYTISNIVESMDALLAQIFYLKPGVDVIVAGVVDSPRVHACDIAHFDGIPSEGECGEMDGPSVRTLVENFRARGFHISFASGMSGAVPRDKEHFPDGIHPSGPGGYEAVAQAWLQAIEDQTSDDATAVAGGLTNSPAFAGP